MRPTHTLKGLCCDARANTSEIKSRETLINSIPDRRSMRDVKWPLLTTMLALIKPPQQLTLQMGAHRQYGRRYANEPRRDTITGREFRGGGT